MGRDTSEDPSRDKWLVPANKTLTRLLIVTMLQMQSPVVAFGEDVEPSSEKTTNYARPNIQQAKLVNDRGLKEREKRKIRRKSQAPAEKKSPKTLQVSAEIGAKVYLFETPDSFSPDFQTDKANLGVSGVHGSWHGSFGLALAEKKEDLTIYSAHASWKPSFGTSVSLGRIPLTGVSGFVADLNHWPSGLGTTDGLTISQSLEGLEAKFLKLEFGAGIGNSFNDDLSFGFGSRSSSTAKAMFGWSHASLGPIRLSGLYGRQNDQITLTDDPSTAALLEERVQDVDLIEGSLGLEFERVQTGGFWSQKSRGPERHSIDGQAFPDSSASPLGSAQKSETYGGGVTFTFPVTLSDSEGEIIFVTGGYTESKNVSEDSPISKEKASAGTIGYRTGPLSLGLSYVYLEGMPSQYVDAFTGQSYSHADRITIGISYKIME